MDLSWCPVCDKQTFAVENLYCSEACRKKDSCSSILDESCCYKFPRCSSPKPYQSPYSFPYNTPESSPITSPKSYPNSNTITDYFSYKSINDNDNKSIIISSSPSDLLLYEMTLSPPTHNKPKLFF